MAPLIAVVASKKPASLAERDRPVLN